MAKKPSATPDKDPTHADALKRADEAWEFERLNVEQGREDQKFYAGDQWDDASKKARGTDRPMLTINRLGTFVRQVTGDIRQNTPASKILPARGEASKEKAEILNGMIRSIEAQSDADACYAKAAENAATAGQGAFRLVTQYVSDKSFDQEIRIQQIADPFGVLLDPLAQFPDKSDARYGFVFERLSKADFKAEYPDATATDFPNVGTLSSLQWMVGESVRIAEYWCREKSTRMLYELPDGTMSEDLPKGVKEVRKRTIEDSKIVSYMMSGTEILSGPHEWAGKYIPIFFVPGEEITIDGATKRKGMVRDAKDPQRLINYARTTEAESTALQPKAPFILTKEEIKGYEAQWRSAGTKSLPFLVYNKDPAGGADRPQRSQPPVMSTGLSNLSTQASMDLHDVTGIYPASLGAKSNETSGVAIRARQHEGDTGSNYIRDNTRRAVAFCGRALVDLIPKIYDTERIVRILKEDGSHEMKPINTVVTDPKTGKVMDGMIGEGEYDVVASTGPSYLTRQQEMADTLVELARTMPIVGQAAPDLIVKALSLPGGDEIAKRLEKMLPPGMLEDGPPQPPPIDPEQLAKAQKIAAETVKIQAETESQEIANATDFVTLQVTVAQIGQGMQQLQAMMGEMMAMATPGGQPPQGGAASGAPPMQAPELPPMPPGDMPMPNGAAEGEAIGELEPMGPIA